jgi:1-acyl-sn-glycerol-3-phosphate acyltransferase
VPITFVDNKKRFSFTFLSGSTGRMRVKVHSFIETKGLKLEDKIKVKNQVRATILKELESYQK